MSVTTEARRGAEQKLAEARSASEKGRHAEAAKLSVKAREAAKEAGDRWLGVRAEYLEAVALERLGKWADATSRYAAVRDAAADPAEWTEGAVAGAAFEIAAAHIDWVRCARFSPEVQTVKLLAVLDAGEAYVRGIGKPSWRAGMLRQRANVLDLLGRRDPAIAAAEEALALKTRDAYGPGGTLNAHRWKLGDMLRRAARPKDAMPHYQAVLDDERSAPFDRSVALQGLARCYLAVGHMGYARSHGEEAVHLAAGLGESALAPVLATFIDVTLTEKDLPSARTASNWMLETARNTGGSYPLYFALRQAARVALAEKDGPRARALVAEAAPLAEAIDRSRGRKTLRDELARYRAEADELR